MHEEIWITKLFNDHLAGLGNAALNLVGWPSVPRPWTNYVAMELLVVALIMLVFAALKARLSAERPGKTQQTFELIYEFVDSQGKEQVEHHSDRYFSFFGTIFIFVLFSNLIGVIPTMESPHYVSGCTSGMRGGQCSFTTTMWVFGKWVLSTISSISLGRCGGWRR